MDRQWYERTTEREMVGLRVRALVSMSNGYITIEPGAILVINRKFKGLDLTGETCPCCHIAPHISRVEPYQVDLEPIPPVEVKRA